ncbi:hypothetical protein [Caballeronia sordidicola]|jgi:hypothetical protein|uniref:hypothetical protein n=1 Tax=Caballeronia sordidicola TaxID=196367 RepID=UPI0015C4EC33|nr:hypothetical protein [Caballeronia sordidicola]
MQRSVTKQSFNAAILVMRIGFKAPRGIHAGAWHCHPDSSEQQRHADDRNGGAMPFYR